MARPSPAVAMVAYVLLSSFLGLTGRYILLAGNLAAAWQFFVWVWTRSALADAVFVGGTVLAGWLAFRLARSHGALLSVVVALALNWAVYWLSYAALIAAGHDVGGIPAVPALRFVGAWGAAGLAFAAVAPALYARWR